MKRINKILGIVLVLAMLAGTMVFAVPASAGDLSWEQVGVPSGAVTKLQITQNTSLTQLAFAPDGVTAFTYDSFVGQLYKSGDAGMTWTMTNIGTNLPAGVIAIAISPNYATDTTLIAATTSQLWRSRNGGATFLQVTGFASVGTINSIDIAPYYISTGGTALMVAGSGGIQLYNDDTNWASITTGNVLKAELSPNYQNDAEVLAVFTGVTNASVTGVIGTGTVLETKFATAAWNTTVRPAQLMQADGITPISTATMASLAFPSDYDSSSSTLNRVYVGLGDNAGGSYDVWRVNGSISGLGSAVKATNIKLSDEIGPDIQSLAYTGTAGTGTLIAGTVDGHVWAATTPNGTAAWTGASNPPTGVNVVAVFPKGSTTLYTATANEVTPGFGSAISTSTDYSVFKEISLISVPNVANITLSNRKFNLGTSLDQFLMLKDTVSSPKISMIFKSVDAGATWAEIFHYSDVAKTIAGINPSPTYATDNTVFAPLNTATIYKSTDGGGNWNNIASTTPDGSISAFAVIDANSYWLGSTSGGGLYKSGSYTKVAALDGNVPFAVVPLPFGIVVANFDGSMYLSTDNAVTFARLGNAGQFAGPPFAFTFDVPGKIIYAAVNGGNELMKWTVGTSTAWAHVDTVTISNALTASAVTIGWLNLAGDGTMYIINTASTLEYQIIRCVNMGAPADLQNFVGIKGTTGAAADFGNANPLAPASQSIVYNATGYAYNVIYQIIGSTSTAVNGYAAQIKKYTDVMVAKPVLSAPTADAQMPVAFAITWAGVQSGGQQVTYRVEVATDAGFAGKVIDATTTATTYFVNGGLIQGVTYWVRITGTLPYPTPPSAAVKFVVKLGQTGNTDLTGPNGNAISPMAGAEGVPVIPTFQWAAVVGASSYHIQVADNPSFTDPIADATTAATFFTLSSPLKPGTVYYWRIQAVSGQIASDYVSMVFTTALAVVAPTGTTTQPPQTVQPTIIVTVPQSTPAPVSTPAYIWVIIAIGAVLVIAVIVLIARTRRV